MNKTTDLKKITFIILFFLIFIYCFKYIVSEKNVPDFDKIINNKKENNEFVVNIKIDNVLGSYDSISQMYYFSNITNGFKKINIISPYKVKYYLNKINDNEYCIVIYSDNYYQIRKIYVSDIPIVNINNLQVVYRNINASSIHFDNNDMFQKKEVGITVYDGNYVKHLSNKKIVTGLGTYRIRGGTSLYFEKKSFKLEFNKGTSLLGMPSDKDWILDALFSDTSKVRNMLSSDIWNLINDNQTIDNDLKGEFVELFIDNKYQGLYVLKEKVDREKTNVSDEGFLLKISSHMNESTYENFLNNNVILQRNTENKLSIEGFEIKYYNYSAYKSFLNKMHNFYLYNQSYNSIKNNYDLSNYLNYKIFLLITSGTDNITKNQYYSLHDFNSKILITPWDMDLTWGLNWSDNVDLYSKFDFECFNNVEWIYKNITSGMDLETLDALKKRYWELRKNVITMDTINSYLDSYKELLIGSGAAKRDSERWYNYDIDFEIEQIREWANNRIIFLDEHFNM